MPLKIEPTNYKTLDDEMTYGDFIIRYEHKFLRNIYTNDQIKKSHHIENLQNYHEILRKFLSISVELLSMLNNYNRNDETNFEVSEFIEKIFTGDTIDEIKN